MPWLVVGDHVLASAEIAEGHRGRAKGLLGRNSVEGAFVLPRVRWIHTVGMQFSIDVAYLDRDGNVLKAVRMAPHRVGVPVVRARMVIEAEAGAFSRWGLNVGDRVEIKA
jgi:uncharacterized membrane protein (UPF0127 family)